MRKIVYEIPDDEQLFVRPHQIVQSLALLVTKEREDLISQLRGAEWNNSTTKGKVVDCTTQHIVVQLPDKTKQELPLTQARLRQLLATTKRK